MVKARHSRKYFGRGKGVVAYTLLCNHIPLNGYLIGAHEYEAHHVFDIWYRNTSDVMPTAITGDMHSLVGWASLFMPTRNIFIFYRPSYLKPPAYFSHGLIPDFLAASR